MSDMSMSGRALNGPVPRDKPPTARQKEVARANAKVRLAEFLSQKNTAALDQDDWHSLITELYDEWLVRSLMER